MHRCWPKTWRGCGPSLELVKKISGGVKRLEALVSQVLAFSREIRISPVASDLSQIVGARWKWRRRKWMRAGWFGKSKGRRKCR